jgi:rhodanese-related sulfurtransferase
MFQHSKFTDWWWSMSKHNQSSSCVNDEDENDDIIESNDDTTTNTFNRPMPAMTSTTATTFTTVSTATAKIQQEERILLLDIRPHAEYQQRHFISTSSCCVRTRTSRMSSSSSSTSYSSSSANRTLKRPRQTQRQQPQLVVVHIPYDELLGYNNSSSSNNNTGTTSNFENQSKNTNRKFELPPRQTPFAIIASSSCFLKESKLEGDDKTRCTTDSLRAVQQEQIISMFHPVKPNHATTDPKHSQTSQSSKATSSLWNIVAVFNVSVDDTIWHDAKDVCNIDIYDGTTTTSTEHSMTNSAGTVPYTMTPQQQQQTSLQSQQQSIQPTVPLPRLWSPDPMIEHILLPLLQAKVSLLQQRTTSNTTASSSISSTNHPQAVMEIWDIGSGLGRDICFLAEELLYSTNNIVPVPQQSKADKSHVFRIVGYDQRYRTNTHTNETKQFWHRRHVDTVTNCCCTDLNTIQHAMDLRQLLSASQKHQQHPSTTITKKTYIGCIYAVRYWNKMFVQAIIDAGINNTCTDDTDTDSFVDVSSQSSLVLERGTIVAISHFGKPTPDAVWNFPHPKEQHVLERNELRTMFTSTTTTTTTTAATVTKKSTMNGGTGGTTRKQRVWNILHDEVVLDSDYGRTLIQFVARLE